MLVGKDPEFEVFEGPMGPSNTSNSGVLCHRAFSEMTGRRDLEAIRIEVITPKRIAHRTIQLYQLYT